MVVTTCCSNNKKQTCTKVSQRKTPKYFAPCKLSFNTLAALSVLVFLWDDNDHDDGTDNDIIIIIISQINYVAV